MGTNVLTQGDDAGRFGKCCEHGMTTVRNKIQQSQREPRPLTDALWKWQHGQLLSFLYSCPFHLLDFFNFFFLIPQIASFAVLITLKKVILNIVLKRI